MNEHEHDWLAERFEADRGHLRAVAYRMLGSRSEAEDAVQEAWLRLSRSYGDDIENLTGWLTSVVGRVCLDMLRSRRSRREEPIEAYAPAPDGGGHLGDRDHGPDQDPERRALMADSVGLALLVVLETLDPAERLAFVLHDMFAVPFDEIARIVDRSPAAARQLASRARRRVRGAEPAPDPGLARRREVVEAFLAAARGGDFDALVAVLAPDVVSRADGGVTALIRGAAAVARGALTYAPFARAAQPALVNGRPGAVADMGPSFRALAFTVEDGRITEIDIFIDPELVRGLDVAPLPAN